MVQIYFYDHFNWIGKEIPDGDNFGFTFRATKIVPLIAAWRAKHAL